MQFSSSLKFNHVFRRLYNKGDSCANRYLVVYCRKNGTKRNRIGLTVGAKLGHAVERNRLRRRLREIYRLPCRLLTGNWKGPICVWPESSAFMRRKHARRRRTHEAGAARAHPILSALYFAGTSEKVPVLADMLAVCVRGDREIRRIKGRVAGF